MDLDARRCIGSPIWKIYNFLQKNLILTLNVLHCDAFVIWAEIIYAGTALDTDTHEFEHADIVSLHYHDKINFHMVIATTYMLCLSTYSLQT